MFVFAYFAARTLASICSHRSMYSEEDLAVIVFPFLTLPGFSGHQNRSSLKRYVAVDGRPASCERVLRNT